MLIPPTKPICFQTLIAQRQPLNPFPPSRIEGQKPFEADYCDNHFEVTRSCSYKENGEGFRLAHARKVRGHCFYLLSFPPRQILHSRVPFGTRTKLVSTEYRRNKRMRVLHNSLVISLNASELVHEQFLASHILAHKTYAHHIVRNVSAGAGIHNENHCRFLYLRAKCPQLDLHILLFLT